MKLAEGAGRGVLNPADTRRLMVPTAMLVALTAVAFIFPRAFNFVAWENVAIGIVVSALLALSAGMLFGRVGLLSLCPATFAGISAWVVAWVTVHRPLPFLVTVAIGALAALPAGLLVGGLAVRLRGVNLAVVTLTFSAGVVSIFGQYKFPGSQDSEIRAIRPMGFESDRMYFLLCLAVLVAVGVGLERYGRTRDGHGWRAVRYSERATAAAGLSVPAVKLKAFIVSAMISGVAGGLMYGQLKGSISESPFLPLTSLVIVAAAVMVGAQSLSGAVLAGILAMIIPEAFQRVGIPEQWAQMLFGVGAVHALSQGGGGISSGFPWRLPRRSQAEPPAFPTSAPLAAVAPSGAPVLEVRNVTVRYGSLTALNQVNLVVPAGAVIGVIGPNGAGKSTLTDTVTGFVDRYEGEIILDGERIDGLNATARSRAGVRRTFQQGRAIPELTAGDYVNLYRAKPLSAAELADTLGFFGLPPADEPISFIDVGTRRILEVAACVASGARVAFLDEPAAGLGHEQSMQLADRIREIPARFGCSVVLIEHNVELVAAVSSAITVLDFGLVLTSGTPQEVLNDSRVAAAYLGEDVDIDAPHLVEDLT